MIASNTGQRSLTLIIHLQAAEFVAEPSAQLLKRSRADDDGAGAGGSGVAQRQHVTEPGQGLSPDLQEHIRRKRDEALERRRLSSGPGPHADPVRRSATFGDLPPELRRQIILYAASDGTVC